MVQGWMPYTLQETGDIKGLSPSTSNTVTLQTFQKFMSTCFFFAKKKEIRINAKVAVAVCTDYPAYTSNLPISISNPSRCPNTPLPSVTVPDQ